MDQKNRLTLALIVLGTSFLIAFIVSSDTSLLPASLISRFLEWLVSLLPFDRNNAGLAMMDLQTQGNHSDMFELMRQAREEQKPLPHFILELLALLKKGLIVLGALFLLYLFIRPFFSADFRAYLRRMKPITAFMNALGNLLVWLRELSSGSKERKIF